MLQYFVSHDRKTEGRAAVGNKARILITEWTYDEVRIKNMDARHLF